MEEFKRDQPLQDIRDIRKLMDRSSRFLSLSGWSGIIAGICALVGAYFADRILDAYDGPYHSEGYLTGDAYSRLKWQLALLAISIFLVAFLSALYLTWRRTKKQGRPFWDHTSRRLTWNMLIPLLAGGLFIIGMLRYDAWLFVAPGCLVFYGLALVNASKYTLTDIRYLGYCEIITGLVNLYFIGYGLWFWAFGFGLLHIIYGIVMWIRHEKPGKDN